MQKLMILCLTFLMLASTEIKADKVVTLKCSRGYSITITFTVKYPPAGELPPVEIEHTLSCPPNSRVTVPGGYESIKAEGTMTGPDGVTRDIIIPAGAGNPVGSDAEWAPWPPMGPFHSYTSAGPVNGLGTTWIRDPLAPFFIQDGEMILGEYDEGTNFQFTIKLIEVITGIPISGASVEVINAEDNTLVTKSISNSDGKIIFNLKAGGDYYLKVESSNYFPQVSDEFPLLGNHMWTMVLTPDTMNVSNASYIIFGIGIILLLISIVLFVVNRRKKSP